MGYDDEEEHIDLFDILKQLSQRRPGKHGISLADILMDIARQEKGGSPYHKPRFIPVEIKINMMKPKPPEPRVVEIIVDIGKSLSSALLFDHDDVNHWGVIDTATGTIVMPRVLFHSIYDAIAFLGTFNHDQFLSYIHDDGKTADRAFTMAVWQSAVDHHACQIMEGKGDE